MRDDSPSRTAAFVAAARQLGQLLPDEARLVDDPYGAAFTSTRAAGVLERETQRLRPLAAMPGVKQWILYMQVRTRLIDDALAEFLATGARQVVLIASSRGGNAVRNYVVNGSGAGKVSHAILGGTPNHGVWADIARAPGSEFNGAGPFLMGLNAPKGMAGDDVSGVQQRPRQFSVPG